jgi:hypothetical protein
MNIIIGDSHSSFFEKNEIMASHWTGPLHKATIFQLLKLGLDLNKIKEELNNSEHFLKVGPPKWKCPDGVYSTPNIKLGDNVFFSYGYNDIQKNIYLHAKQEPEKEIDRLVDGYIDLLLTYQKKYNIRCVVCSIPPNPLPFEIKKGNFEYGIGGEFRAEGSSKERIYYTKYANNRLKKISAKKNIDFIDPYRMVTDKDGYINKKYTTDYVHIDNPDENLLNHIREIIYRMNNR